MLRKMLRPALLSLTAIISAGCIVTSAAAADTAEVTSTIAEYHVNPGDVLEVYVWNEKDLTREVLVRPDGYISVPLAGQIAAGGHSIADIEAKLSTALGNFLKDKPTVTVSLRQGSGYKIYVLGKVNRPGEYPVVRPTDVMQALALAGGLNAFAAENDISILHREPDGKQKSVRFRYSDVKVGEELKSNAILQSGDIVVVP